MLLLFIANILIITAILFVVAVILNLPREPKKLLLAATVSTLLTLLTDLPVIGPFLPFLGLYMVLVGPSYESHQGMLKLCIITGIIHFLINALLLSPLLSR